MLVVTRRLYHARSTCVYSQNMKTLSDIGLVGLALMGENLVLNMES